MKANSFSHLCRFQGGLPIIVFRDHVGGRIQLWLAGRWIATVAPGHVMSYPEHEMVMLSKTDDGDEDAIEIEWRGTYGACAAGISVLQQTADWFAADDAFYEASEIEKMLGL